MFILTNWQVSLSQIFVLNPLSNLNEEMPVLHVLKSMEISHQHVQHLKKTIDYLIMLYLLIKELKVGTPQVLKLIKTIQPNKKKDN